MDEASEQQIRAVVDERVRAVRAKDPAPLAARQDEQVVTFDVLPPLLTRGPGPVVEKTRRWFEGYESDIGYRVEQFDVVGGEDVGFCSFVYNVQGRLRSGEDVDMWVRATLGLRKDDAGWRIVHDHESVPFDPQTGMAVIDLVPERRA